MATDRKGIMDTEGTLVEQAIMLHVNEWQLIAEALGHLATDDEDRDFGRDCARLRDKIVRAAPEAFAE